MTTTTTSEFAPTGPVPLSLIVLAYNEAENIGPVLAELTTWLSEHAAQTEIIVVDDGSSDGTGEAAAAALEAWPHRVIRHAQNRGMGAGIKSGVRVARGELITFLPADGQIAPEAVGTLLDAQTRDDADVVLSVYDHRDDGLHRTILSFGVRALILLVHGVRMKSDGPYLFRRRLFDPEQLKPDTFFLNFEFPIRVLAAGLKVSTVTIACRPRLAGYSKSAGVKRALMVGVDLLEFRQRRNREARAAATGRR